MATPDNAQLASRLCAFDPPCYRLTAAPLLLTVLSPFVIDSLPAPLLLTHLAPLLLTQLAPLIARSFLTHPAPLLLTQSAFRVLHWSTTKGPSVIITLHRVNNKGVQRVSSTVALVNNKGVQVS